MSYIRKINFYDADYNFVDFAHFDASQVEFVDDLLSITSTTFTFPSILEVQQGMYAICEEFQGVVTSVSFIDDSTEVSIAPLISLLDIDVAYQGSIRTRYTTLIQVLLSEAYDSSSQHKLKGYRFENAQTYTADTLILEKSVDIFNVYDVLLDMFKMYNIYMDIYIDVGVKSIIFTLKRDSEVENIKLERPYVLDYEIVTEPLSQGVSAVHAFWVNNDSQVNDELIVNSPRAYMLTKPKYILVSVGDNEDFYEKAQDEARKVFATDKDDYITITVSKSSQIIPTLYIGKKVKLLHKTGSYDTIVTKVVRIGDIIEYTFGNIRVNLTDILKGRRF